ncbi:MAG TPA: ribosome maturation factor RimM [Chryseolinea sp.]|nr:ribosome maturation factor RimM [Chryseolinea sp.]
MEISACFNIGYVVKTHGLKGEVTISLSGYAVDDLVSVQKVYPLFIEINNRLVPYFIQSISESGTKAFVKFEDVDTVEEASKLAKRSLYLQKAARPKAERGDFYDDEIINFSVTDEVLGPLGSVVEVVQAGPNRLLVLDHNGKELMIPVNSPFIKRLNKSKKIITVSLPEGYLDI